MKRSTGFRSQNKHIHGHAADIAKQERLPKSLVYQWVCLLALSHEIIDAVEVLGEDMPRHESEWTTAQAAAIVDMIHAEADVRGWWMTEYIDGVPTRVKYGGAKP